MKEELDRRVQDGLLNARVDGDLVLYSYTPKCVGTRAWDPYTRAARGLVLRSDGTVVARPWAKFFNLGEQPETEVGALPRELPELSEKVDGSLIVVFHDGRRWRAVTRGSWESEQAQWAGKWLSGPAPVSQLSHEYTYLFELVAPWNRVVLPYEKEEMLFLGRVETATGRDDAYEEAASVAGRLGLRSPAFRRGSVDSLDLADRRIRGAEGFVARFSNGLRVKLKFESYLELHAIVTGMTARGVWERLQAGEPPFPEDLPDEFLDWYSKTRDSILGRKAALEKEIEDRWSLTDRSRPRGDIAREWSGLDHTLKSCLFVRLDGKSCESLLWKAVYPEGDGLYFGKGT